MSYNFSVITNHELVIWYYQSNSPNGKCIIVGIWAPNLMDVDSLRNASLLTEAGYDVLVPEYYGFCRSQWKFTPMNSIQALIDTFFIARWQSQKTLKNVYSWKKIPSFSYEDISFLGMSYGWFAVLMLPKFLPQAKKIIALYPVVDYGSFWKRWVQEETAEDFYESILRGFHQQYRGIEDIVWQEQFQDNLWLSPLYALNSIKGTSLFLAHGTTDVSIFYKKTAEYFELLKKQYPKQNIVYKQYYWKGHWVETMIPATQDAILWLESNTF